MTFFLNQTALSLPALYRESRNDLIVGPTTMVELYFLVSSGVFRLFCFNGKEPNVENDFLYDAEERQLSNECCLFVMLGVVISLAAYGTYYPFGNVRS